MSSDRIVVSTHGLAEIEAQFLAAPEQMESARQRALRKTVSFIGAQARREIAQAIGAKPKGLQTRVVPRVFQQSAEIRFGLNPIPADLLGTPSQDAGGASVPGFTFPGAFVARIYKTAGGAAQDRVWIRLHSKRFDADLYPYNPRKFKPTCPAELRHRFPVVLARVPLDTQAVRGIIAAQAEAAGLRLKVVLAQELNYATNVEGQKA